MCTCRSSLRSLCRALYLRSVGPAELTQWAAGIFLKKIPLLSTAGTNSSVRRSNCEPPKNIPLNSNATYPQFNFPISSAPKSPCCSSGSREASVKREKLYWQQLKCLHCVNLTGIYDLWIYCQIFPSLSGGFFFFLMGSHAVDLANLELSIYSKLASNL